MGTNIHGWVEAAVKWDNGAMLWRSVISLEMAGAAHRDYPVFERVFGAATKLGGDVSRAPGHGRGLPKDISYEARTEIRDWVGRSYTWISAAELLSVNWLSVAPFPNPWTRMVELMRLLVQVHGMDNLRIVAWFCD